MFDRFQALEGQHGSMFTLGFLIGFLANKKRTQGGETDKQTDTALNTAIKQAVNEIGKDTSIILLTASRGSCWDHHTLLPNIHMRTSYPNVL